VWRQPECRDFGVAELPTRQPGLYPGCVPLAASCRTDVGWQPWPQHHVGRRAVRAVGVENARARMYAASRGAGCAARRL